MRYLLISLVSSLILLLSCNETEAPQKDDKPIIDISRPVGVDRQLEEDRLVNFDISFSDDLGLDHFSITSLSLGLAIDSVLGGVIEFEFKRNIFVEAEIGQHTLEFSVTDTGGQLVKETIILDRVESNIVTVSLDPSNTYQTIRSFGASDAWSTQFVGKNWEETERQEMAQLLFGTGFDEFGNPLGIGLSGWRFNIGAGSAEQGAGSDITDVWRRAESFINADGSYDWSKQEGQLWFLEQAEAHGLVDLTAFVNSPPVHLTRNGKAYSSGGSSANLNPDSYADYAVFLSKVLEYLKNQKGIDINYISPVNEPQWEWKCCNQEGSPWSNQEITKLVKTMDSVLMNHDLSTKIDITEAGKITFLDKAGESTNRDDQVEWFFNPASSGYVADLPSMANHISGHSYFTTYDINTLKTTRDNLKNSVSSIGGDFEFWMTEYTLLEDNAEIKGNGRDLGMDPAIYMARVLHADMVLADAAAWYWWLAISPYDYKDGLIYIDKNQSGGNYYTSKMLWGMGNFSRFIRPGMKRIGVSRSGQVSELEDLNGLMQSAYSSGDEMVVVFVNTDSETKEITFDILDGYEKISMYQTSSSKDLSFVRDYTADETILISARSIVTCVIK